MTSSDYRRIARENLAGNWANAILAALIAGLLGGLLATGGSFNTEVDAETASRLPDFLLGILAALASLAGTLALVNFIIGGVIRQGYCLYLLKQHDKQNPQLNDLFSQFHRFGDGFCLALLQTLFIVLWTLLFIIPGIIAGYKYAMAPFILLENPDMTASEAITASKELMDGHKAELFFLDLSFIGWTLLSVLTFGIGNLWLNPYMNASYAAFYREISRT